MSLRDCHDRSHIRPFTEPSGKCLEFSKKNQTQKEKLTFEQPLIIVSNDNEIEEEYKETESLTASKICEVLRDSTK